ncbi:MAG: class I SAM-dependent methyltransferase [Bauldia sp.]|nr:class I SAM-dependent methyltransferase [Bauldia sp.]
MTIEDPEFGSVNRYYNGTVGDYWLAWTNKSVSAVHFGYFGDGARSHSEALIATSRRIADLAAISEGSLVVDAGCGLGGSSLWLASERQARVVGLNVNFRQMVLARQSAAERGLSRRARFVIGDYTAMPLRTASVDAVIAIESVVHAPDKAAFYREAARVLKPGGRLAMAEYMLPDRWPDELDTSTNAEWLRGWAIPGLDSGASHLAHAAAAGLDDVAVMDVTEYVEPSLYLLHNLTFAGLPAHNLLSVLGLRTEVQRENLMSSRLQYRALQAGGWFYAHLRARKPGP